MTFKRDVLGNDSYRLLVGAVMDYAIYLLDAEGNVTSWNPGASRFKGYRADEIVGKHFSVFYTEEDRRTGVPAQALETARREGRFEAEGWRVRKDGSTFWCSVVIDAVRDDHGEIVGFAKITRDITEKKLHQEESQAARDAMHHVQKMEAIARLTGGVAHDFNNFLTAIRFSAEFLQRSPELPPSLMRYVRTIVDTTDRAGQLTRQLLAYTKKQPLQPQFFDVCESLTVLRPLLLTSVGSAISIRYDFLSAKCGIYADPGQFQSALLNLVINARDAMPSGGQIEIGVRVIPDVASTAVLRGPLVALSVNDTGVGIAEDVLEHVFEPFFSTKGQHENSGLGLSQVQGFVQQSGGDVTVETKVGAGTTFTLYLPAAEGSGTASSTLPTVAASPVVAARKDILLVEDNALVGEVVSALLESWDQSLTWMLDAESALEVLEDRQGRFDVAILDLVLPGMNGIQLAREIRQRWPRVRIVLASGYSEAMVGAQDMGFKVLQKPYSANALAEVLTNDC